MYLQLLYKFVSRVDLHVVVMLQDDYFFCSNLYNTKTMNESGCIDDKFSINNELKQAIRSTIWYTDDRS